MHSAGLRVKMVDDQVLTALSASYEKDPHHAKNAWQLDNYILHGHNNYWPFYCWHGTAEAWILRIYSRQ